MDSWEVDEAGRDSARLIEAATREPQAIMRRSECVGILLPPAHYRQMKAEADAQFADFILASPLCDGDFDPDVGLDLSGGGQASGL